MDKLTQKEADLLMAMMKTVLEKEIEFPNQKGRIELKALGNNEKDEFIINISRKGINSKCATYQGRHKRSGAILIRIDINPTGKRIHTNPDGISIEKGISHIHIYREDSTRKEGDSFAIPFDSENKELHEICSIFFKKFNIANPPKIIYKPTLNDFL